MQPVIRPPPYSHEKDVNSKVSSEASLNSKIFSPEALRLSPRRGRLHAWLWPNILIALRHVT